MHGCILHLINIGPDRLANWRDHVGLDTRPASPASGVYSARSLRIAPCLAALEIKRKLHKNMSPQPEVFKNGSVLCEIIPRSVQEETAVTGGFKLPDQTIVFAGDKVALIVRGKTTPSHSPGVLEQHADCVRSDGSPVGYFGEAGEGSGYIVSAVLIGIHGEVYDMDSFRQNRPHYVDANVARGYGVVSTALVVRISSAQAALFDEYWNRLADDPGTFRLLGQNCSTRASGAFRHAGILVSGIPGLDTPNNLYRQLVAQRRDICESYSGYIGFTSTGANRSMVVGEL
jgi:hypothetical protein